MKNIDQLMSDYIHTTDCKGLSINNWLDIYKEIKKKYKESQRDYYKRNNASDDVLNLVSLESKRFGSISEKIIISLLNLGPRKSTEHDAIKKGKKIEIKSARYWGSKDECKWQHLELTHDYDCVLFCLIDFDGTWKIWGIRKELLFGELREKGILSHQGKQGWWTNKSQVIEYCSVIKGLCDLDNFLDTV